MAAIDGGGNLFLGRRLLARGVAQRVDRAVPHDRVHPGAARAQCGIVARGMPPDLHESVVHDFLRQFSPLQDPLGDADHGAGLLLVDRAQCGAISAPAGGEQRRVIVPASAQFEGSSPPDHPNPAPRRSNQGSGSGASDRDHTSRLLPTCALISCHLIGKHPEVIAGCTPPEIIPGEPASTLASPV